MSALIASRPPRPWEGHGCDTETYQGWARLICTPTEWAEIPRGNWRKALGFIVNNGPALAFWNLRFDAEAIIKHLPRESIYRLLALERLEIGPYLIELIPWKMLRVTRGHQSTECYDFSPFFRGSLDQAARILLNDKKNDEELGIDRARLNTDPHVWKDFGRILRYCQKDAWITERVANIISRLYTELGGSMHRPYSPAFVAADMLMRDTEPPRLAPHMYDIADQAYGGGRFECIIRGRIPRAWIYDIKSCYPNAQAELRDTTKGRWVSGRRIHKDALHAIVQCIAHVPRDEYPIIAPFPYKPGRSSPIIYPTGTFRTTVHLATYKRFEELLSIEKAWSLIPQGPIIQPYRRTITRLVDFRAHADPHMAPAAKTAGASLYGKLLDQRLEKHLERIDGDVDHFKEKIIIMNGEPHRVGKKKVKGMLSHPHHAGLVTEAGRLRLWEPARKHQDRLVMMMTDGLMFDKQVMGRPKAQKMGEWGVEDHGDAVSCGSGRYQIKGRAPKTRGSSTHIGERPRSWFQMLRGVRKETVRFVDTRPAHLAECLNGTTPIMVGDEVRSLGFKDANVFLPFVRDYNVCRDKKREWPLIGQARRLLKERFRSEPLNIEAVIT